MNWDRVRLQVRETYLDDLLVLDLMESQLAQVKGFRERLGVAVPALFHH